MTGENLEKLTITAAELFIKVLEVEVHEKTLCYTLETLSLWTNKLIMDVPKKIIDFFKVCQDIEKKCFAK